VCYECCADDQQSDDLERSRSIDFAFMNQLPLTPTPDDLKVTYDLLMCASDVAPAYPDEKSEFARSLSVTQHI
jgi:hypothetical protein